MIRLCYSNATEELLDALAAAIADERRAGHALQPVRLVVPNANIETYVKLGLAERAGIAAHLEVTFLRRFLARIAERAFPRARAVDADLIEGCLLAVFHDDHALAAPVLAPVRQYLHAAGDGADAVDRRRGQLASQLARLFDEYASSRAKMLADWRAAPRDVDEQRVDDAEAARATAGARDEPARFAALERWQRALWRRIFAAGGVLEDLAARTGITYLPLADLLAQAEDRLDAGALGPTLHVFGVSYMAASYHRMLALLAQHVDVRIYTLNPCREFWEDLDTTAEAAARRTKKETRRLFPTRREGSQPLLALDDDPFALGTDAEMMALRLWGRPGRENVRLLNQLTDADFEGRFRSHHGATVRTRRCPPTEASPCSPAPACAASWRWSLPRSGAWCAPTRRCASTRSRSSCPTPARTRTCPRSAPCSARATIYPGAASTCRPTPRTASATLPSVCSTCRWARSRGASCCPC